MAVDLGRIGIWVSCRRNSPETAREADELGFGAIWVGGSPAVDQVRPFLEASGKIPVATGIVNVWRHDPATVAGWHADLQRDFDGRFVLGIGVGHREATQEYEKPLAKMRSYLDALEVPADELVLAALGPKMLDLAAERSRGTHPYFTVPQHTAFARERVGEGVLVAPELAVVLEADTDKARQIAREYAATYLRLTNYTARLLQFGFSERDLESGGSDRLIDAVIPHGPAEAVAEVVHAHLEAGADHVCVQPLGHGEAPVEDYRELARVLL